MSEMELLAKSGLRSEGQAATKAPFISSDWQPHDDTFLDALILKMTHIAGNNVTLHVQGSPTLPKHQVNSGNQLIDW
jgi:hypothetical protein